MWRWLHSLPRAIRNQFHPTGASAGVCVEDISDNESRLRKTAPELKTRETWKEHCWESRYRNNGRKRRCGRSGFWEMVHGPCSFDTLKCGPILTAGLQISHTKGTRGNKNDSSEDRRKRCLFYKVTDSLPSWTSLTGSIGRHILPADKPSSQTQQVKPDRGTTRQNDQPAVESLEDAFANFEQVCKKYTAVGKGIMACRAADSGHMDTAVRLWQESSKLGYGKSQFNLAVCYETGRGVQKDMSKAIWYYRQAAEDNHAMAMYNLALLYMEGAHDLAPDTNRAITFLTHAADLGLAEAQKYLGVYYSEDDKDTAKAVYYLTKAADQNDGEAQYLLGMCYESGYGVQENGCKAAHWFTKSAETGSADAMYSLATFHQQGLGGLPVNHDTAKTLFQKAAELGHEEAVGELRKYDKESSVPLKTNFDMASLVVPENQEPLDIGYLVKMNSCVSAPCLSDLVRQDLIYARIPVLYDPISQDGTRSQIFSQLMVPRALTELPSLKEMHKKRGSVSDDDSGSDSGVSFKLGSDDDEDSDISPSASPSSSYSHYTLHRRNYTMPDLQIVAK